MAIEKSLEKILKKTIIAGSLAAMLIAGAGCKKCQATNFIIGVNTTPFSWLNLTNYQASFENVEVTALNGKKANVNMLLTKTNFNELSWKFEPIVGVQFGNWSLSYGLGINCLSGNNAKIATYRYDATDPSKPTGGWQSSEVSYIKEDIQPQHSIYLDLKIPMPDNCYTKIKFGYQLMPINFVQGTEAWSQDGNEHVIYQDFMRGGTAGIGIGGGNEYVNGEVNAKFSYMKGDRAECWQIDGGASLEINIPPQAQNSKSP